MIELGLSESFLTTQNAVLRTALDRCLRLVEEALSLQDDPDEHLDLLDAVGRCRREIAAATDTDQISAQVEKCFELCRAAMGRARARAGAHRMQLEAMVAFIRATLANLTGDSLSVELMDTTRRLDALARLDDIAKVKAGIDAEVFFVTKVVTARQRALQAQVESLQQQLSDAEAQLLAAQEDAARDELTGVANRRQFERVLDRGMKAAAQQLVVGLIDLDDFKSINDTHGHQTGDSLLVAVADTLRNALEPPDVVARLGGDEFAVIMYGVTLRRAEYCVRSIVTAVSALRVPAGESSVGLTISSGLAELSAGDTRKTLIGRADQALYDAKRQGKQRVATKSTPLIRDIR